MTLRSWHAPRARLATRRFVGGPGHARSRPSRRARLGRERAAAAPTEPHPRAQTQSRGGPGPVSRDGPLRPRLPASSCRAAQSGHRPPPGPGAEMLASGLRLQRDRRLQGRLAAMTALATPPSAPPVPGAGDMGPAGVGTSAPGGPGTALPQAWEALDGTRTPGEVAALLATWEAGPGSVPLVEAMVDCRAEGRAGPRAAGWRLGLEGRHACRGLDTAIGVALGRRDPRGPREPPLPPAHRARWAAPGGVWGPGVPGRDGRPWAVPGGWHGWVAQQAPDRQRRDQQLAGAQPTLGRRAAHAGAVGPPRRLRPPPGPRVDWRASRAGPRGPTHQHPRTTRRRTAEALPAPSPPRGADQAQPAARRAAGCTPRSPAPTPGAGRSPG